jgi:hypothetical protein
MAKKKTARTPAARRRTIGKRIVQTAAAPKRTARHTVKKAAPPARRRTAPTARTRTVDPLLAPMQGVERHEIGHVRLDVGRAGAARVKRMVYPAGFRWSVDMKPVVGTDLCMHAHVGFLAKGEIHISYEDGCVVEHKAPQIVAIEPGHDGWVVGEEPVVLIEFDFESETISRLGDARRPSSSVRCRVQ